MASDALLRALTQQEKLAFFYCAYVREEALDADADADAQRWWDKMAAASPASATARRKARERVSWLLNQIENASATDVRLMDATFRAKRELLLLAEGSIRSTTFSLPSYQRSARNGGGPLGDPQALERLEHARANNELLQECGALPVFSDHLQQSVHAFRGLNFQHLDLDKVDQLVNDLQRDMTLMYLLIVFNAHKQNVVFDRQLMLLGIGAPTYSLVTILDCLSQLNVLPGFPIKRLLLLFHEWFAAVLGNFDSLVALKKLRRERNGTDPSVFEDEARGRLMCKTLKKAYYDTTVLENQDPYYLQKLKFVKMREELHNKYLHKPMYELKLSSEASDERRKAVDDDDPVRATAPLDALDDEWEERCEQVYQLFLPCMREYTTFLSNLVTLSCGSALNARDKKTFYSRRPSSGDQLGPMYNVTSGDNYGMGNMGMGGGPDSNNDNQFWKWILREKTIVLDVACLTVLLIFKHFRASHACKAEYFMQFFLENNLLATLTKFMNKDIATYLRQDSGGDEPKSGFYALERELEKLNLRVEDDVLDYSLQSTRTITSILRILQKLTKRKPNIIKNGLCRSSSIVWLKRVVSLQIPLPRLYALKLVKSQAKYLGPQWMRKYTCISLLTEIYLHVRPELNDDWLHYEDEDLNKPPSQDSVERLLFGEMQAYHHKYYFDSVLSQKPLPQGASLLNEARKELASDAFIVDGGRAAKLYNDLKLDPVNFCQQYEKWLDNEKLTHDANAANAPLPIAFS